MDDFIQLNIRIDKEGVWFFGTAEIFRKGILQIFYQNLKLDSSGMYLIELGDEKCQVHVEDTAFVVKTAYKQYNEELDIENIFILLSDGEVEELNSETLAVGKENVLYCVIKSGKFKARFTRQAYYQLAQFIEYDASDDSFFIPLNGRIYYINQNLETDS